MDSGFWTARIAKAKRQSRIQNNNFLNRSHLSSQLDDFDAEEEVRSDYPCPYCYEQFDFGSLCSHIEDEHSGESRAAGCPVCPTKVSGDMLTHIIMQHGHLLKSQRPRRLHRIPVPSSPSLSLLGRDLREAHLQMLLGGGGSRSNSSTASTSVSDNLLSSLVINFPASETDEISKSFLSSLEENSSKRVTSSQHLWKSSFLSSLSHEERERRMRQAAGRALFVQDLFTSTLVTD